MPDNNIKEDLLWLAQRFPAAGFETPAGTLLETRVSVVPTGRTHLKSLGLMLVWNSVIIRKALIMVAWTNLCISFHCGCNPHFQRNLNRLTNTPLRSVNIHHETKVVNEGEVKTEVDSDNTESWSQTMSVLFEPTPFTADGVVQLCDRIEESDTSYRVNAILRHKRRKALLSILQRDRDEYITIVSFLGARIPRDELPNAQGVPYPVVDAPLKEHILTKEDVDTNVLTDDVLGGLNKTIPLIADCNLQPMQYRDSVLDRFLLARFRGLVQKEVGFISNTKGII